MTLPISAKRSSTKALSLATSSLSARTSCMIFLGSRDPLLLARRARGRQLPNRHYSKPAKQLRLGARRRKSGAAEQRRQPGRDGGFRGQRQREPQGTLEEAERGAARFRGVDRQRQRAEGVDGGQEAGVRPSALEPRWAEPRQVPAHD